MSSFNFERDFFNYLNGIKNYMAARPLTLGGTSGGGGGSGGPPGGFIGHLPQTRVSYDTSELSAITTSGVPSLLDNLNHIRARIDAVTTSGGHTIQDEGTSLSPRAKLNFIGSGVTVTDNSTNNSSDVHINVTGSGHTIQYYGTSKTSRTNLNFIGTGVTVTDNAGTDSTDISITVSGGSAVGWQTLSNTANIDWNLALGNAQVTLSGEHNLLFPSNINAGSNNFLKVIQDGAGTGVLTLASGYMFSNGSKPTITSTSNAVDIIQFFSDGIKMFGNKLTNFKEIISLFVLANSTPTSTNIRSDTMGTTITFAHTVVSGYHQILLVGIGGEGESDTMNALSVAYNGTNLIRIARNVLGYGESELWYLLDPEVGTFNIVVELSQVSNGGVGAMVFKNVSQTDPIYTNTYATGVQNTHPEIYVNTTPGNIVFGVVGHHGIEVTDSSNTTEAWSVSHAGNSWEFYCVGSYTPGIDGYAHLSWNPTSDDQSSWVVTAISLMNG